MRETQKRVNAHSLAQRALDASPREAAKWGVTNVQRAVHQFPSSVGAAYGVEYAKHTEAPTWRASWWGLGGWGTISSARELHYAGDACDPHLR
jgi:hypothetical protein